VCELEPPSHHEEQLPCPASWCAHSSAAVSGLLWHQMAVSILRRGAVSLFEGLRVQTASKRATSPRYEDIVRASAGFRVPWRAQGPAAALKQAPAFPELLLIKGEAIAFCTCVSDEGDSRLARGFLELSRKTPSVKGAPRSQIKCAPPTHFCCIIITRK